MLDIEQKIHSSIATVGLAAERSKDFLRVTYTEVNKEAHQMVGKIKDLGDHKEIIKKTGLGMGMAVVFTALVMSVNISSNPVYAGDGGTPEKSTATATATPNALATKIAETRQTLDQLNELQRSLDALRNPTPAPAPAPQQPPQGGVVIVPQQVVQPPPPEVVMCEPKVVPVPQFITPVPNPNVVPVTLDQLNAEHAKGKKEGEDEAQQALKDCSTAKDAAIQAKSDAEMRALAAINVSQGKVDWWWIPVTGILALGTGAVAFTRHTVIERIHHHGPPGVPHTHPHP